MGLLDRLSYSTTSRIPTGWKDTLVQPTRIEVPQFPAQPNRPALALIDISIEPDRSLSDAGQEVEGQQEHTPPPPKKRRYM
jgi:hypothetical protein